MLLLCELIRCLMFKFEQTTPPPGRVLDPVPSAVPMVPSAPGRGRTALSANTLQRCSLFPTEH